MEPGSVKCAQESIFWGKYDHFWAKHPKIWYRHIRKPSRHLVCIVVLVGHDTKRARNAIIWPKMTKNVYLGPKLAVLGPNFQRREQKFWYPNNRKPHRHLVCIVFGRVSHEMGQKGKFLAQNDQKCQFWAGRIQPGQKSIFFGEGAKLLIPSYRGTKDTSSVLKALNSEASMGC